MKEQKIHNVDLLWIILLVLAVYFLFYQNNEGITAALSLVLLSVLAGWTLSLSARIVQRQIRFLLIFCGCLLFLWYGLRFMKYYMINDTHLARYIWYLYYFPMLFLPSAFLRVSLLLGQPEGCILPRRMYLLYLPAAVLFLLVLSNDWHQLVFSFPDSSVYSDHLYVRQTGFFLCVFWIALCIVLSLLNMAWRTGVPQLHRVVWVPWIPAAIMAVYSVVYALWLPSVGGILRDMTAVYCILSMGLLESCIRTGLIPANMYHLRLFQATPFPAVITDPSFTCGVSSAAGLILDKDRAQTICSAGMIREGTVRLHGNAISSGYVIWQEDVQEVQTLLDQIQQTNAVLEEENDLLEADNALRQRQIQSKEQHRLYDLLAETMYPCLQEMEQLLSCTDRTSFLRLVFLGTYTKRKSNLFLLEQEQSFCSIKELEFCLQESAETLQAAGIECSVHYRGEGHISCRQAGKVYDLFQNIVSQLLPGLQALFISIVIEENICMTLMADLDADLPVNCSHESQFSVSMEDGAFTYRLLLEREQI